MRGVSTRPSSPSWLALALAALAAAGCDTVGRTGTTDEAVDEAMTEGGYTATGAELSATDARGEPRYTLRAAAIEQTRGTEPVSMTDVTVEFPDSRGQSWVLTAKTGRMSSTGREDAAIVDLEGDVRLRSDAAGPTGPLQLDTDALRFDTAKNRATTDRPVTLRSGERTISARGLTADLGSRRLKLESEVHGRFTP